MPETNSGGLEPGQKYWLRVTRGQLHKVLEDRCNRNIPKGHIKQAFRATVENLFRKDFGAAEKWWINERLQIDHIRSTGMEYTLRRLADVADEVKGKTGDVSMEELKAAIDSIDGIFRRLIQELEATKNNKVLSPICPDWDAAARTDLPWPTEESSTESPKPPPKARRQRSK